MAGEVLGDSLFVIGTSFNTFYCPVGWGESISSALVMGSSSGCTFLQFFFGDESSRGDEGADLVLRLILEQFHNVERCLIGNIFRCHVHRISGFPVGIIHQKMLNCRNFSFYTS